MRPVLSSAEAAARCGTTTEHMRKLAREGRIPHVRVGKLLRFDPDELEAWLDAHRVEPAGVA